MSRRRTRRHLSLRDFTPILAGFLLALAVLYTLYFAQAFLIPTVAAIVLAMIVSPIADFLEERARVPRPAAALLAVLGPIVVCAGLAIVLAPALETWVDRAPQIFDSAQEKLRGLRESVAALRQASEQMEKVAELPKQDGPGQSPAAIPVVIAGRGLLADFAVSAPLVAVQVLYAIVMSFFMLAERSRIRHRVICSPPSLGMRLRLARIVREISDGISQYLFSVAVINTGLGVCTAAALHLLGVPDALLWGAAMGLFNFIPIFGPILMIGVIGAVCVVTFDTLGQAVVPIGAVLILHLIESQIVYPWVLGRRVAASPLAVFFAVAFGGWMWGVVGAFIAVPVLIVCVAIVHHMGPR
ncbi:MAG: AI-2E family transporter [Rhodospirillales bacterium]